MWGLSRVEGEFLKKSIYSRHSHALSKAPGCVSGSLFRHWCVWSLQTRDPGFQVVIAMCWSFCTLWELTWCLHCVPPPSDGGFLIVSCLLRGYQEAVSRCAGILVTEIGHHQNLSPVASSGASTPKQFCSFSLPLSLRVFNTVFYRCRQLLPPVTIHGWVRAVGVKMKVHLKFRSWAKMFF